MTEMTDTPFLEPLQIGSVAIQSRVILAPMAGVTDVAFRGLVRQWAPDSLICTEMISSNGLVYSKRWDAEILDKTETDHPIAYQLAAHRPHVLLEAAQNIIRDKQPATIDLNMGCPVKKITGNFEGCALMKDPDLAYQLIRTLTRELDTPVTVKFRLGWDSQSMNYIEFGQMCEAAGAKMVTLHARTRVQGYAPGCKWEAFGELKQALNIPVIANGDINTLEDAWQVMTTYGVDGVMIGRGALGKPWIIGQIAHSLKTGQTPTELTLEQRMSVAIQHARRLVAYKGETAAIREMRRHLTDYVSGFRGAKEFRGRMVTVSTFDDVQQVVADILAANQEAMALAS